MFLKIFFPTLIVCLIVGPTWAAVPTHVSPSIELENIVHFLTADGSDVVIPPGTYQVEAAESWLRVIPGERHEAWLLMATAETHKKEIDQPIAFTVPGEEDELFLVLMLPSGKSLEALGTSSGVRSRAVRRLSSARRYRALQSARSRARAPRRTIPTLVPEPTIRTFSPKDKVLAGETIRIIGQNLRPQDFIAQLGQSPATPLPVKRGGNSSIIEVRVPRHAGTAVKPFMVRHKSGRWKTLKADYQVIARPQVTSVQVLEGPWIGVPSSIQVTLANLPVPLRNSHVALGSSACWTQGGGTTLPASGSTATLVFPITFRPSGSLAQIPGDTPTARLAALSGKSCLLELLLRPPGHLMSWGKMSTGSSVTLPQVSVHTILQTWDLVDFTTPSGKKFGASANPPVVCSPLSVGKSGSFPIGVVKYNKDLSFQIRNAALPISCSYKTFPQMEVKQGWIITEVEWNFSGNEICHLGGAMIPHFEWSPGHWGAGDSHNTTELFPIKVDGACDVDGSHRLNNKHVFRAILKKITLIGPPQQTWQSAFK